MRQSLGAKHETVGKQTTYYIATASEGGTEEHRVANCVST